MTSEIALMNRHAIALAADSAITVTLWRDGVRKHRYFKGANKIFNLSAYEPVALMINGTADLQGVPWEVIAKAFREALGNRRLSTLAEYSKEFFAFIETNTDIYPAQHRLERFLSDVQTSAAFLIYLIDGDDKVSKETDADKRKEIALPKWADLKKRISSHKFISPINQESFDSITGKHLENICAAIRENETVKKYLDIWSVEELSATAIEALLKKGFSILPNTGIVIAGFGTQDFFPKIESHNCHSIVLGTSLCECESLKEIGPKNSSEVMPFAQSDMVKTFINGVSDTVLRQLDTSHQSALKEFSDNIKGDGLVSDGAALDKKCDEFHDNFGDKLTTSLVNSHTLPMRQVVGLLPIDELAELAEILIRIESLKERVTRETEQIGGPIDVAVLSKGDGFIWIKRKHYFDPELNPRYFSRRGASYDQKTPQPRRKVRSRSAKAGPD